MTKKMTQEQYLNNRGFRCPFCREKSAENDGSFEAQGKTGYQDVNCGACGAKWVDKYELKGYEVVQETVKEKGNE
jgi:hypothetical protein